VLEPASLWRRRLFILGLPCVAGAAITTGAPIRKSDNRKEVNRRKALLDMRPVLSPAESLGLSGATLEGRIRRAATHVADATFARIAERLKADAFANEMIYERDGVREPIRVMLRPLLAMNEQFDYVHYVCLQMTEALRRLPALYLQDPEIRKIIAVAPDEDTWLRRA